MTTGTLRKKQTIGVADRREREELKRTVRELKYNNQADKLASRYPSVYEHLDSFIGIVEASKGAITLAELCKAKLDESTADIPHKGRSRKFF